jgi:LacI family transcriptional regulator
VSSDNETAPEDGKAVRRRGGPPTIGDVARLAGTSEATVSRALRGSRRVGEELRRSVVQAAEALDYTPNPHAQALARSVDAAIGVVVHDTGDPYFVEILRGILDPAERSGRMVMVCDTRRDPDLEFAYVRHFRTQRVQALLLAGSGFEDRAFGAQMTSEISAFERSGARVALIGRHHILGDSVVPDNEDGAYQMARALIDLGHSRIGVISGPPSLTTTQDRLAGIRRAFSESGIESELIRSGDFTRDRGAAATDELLAADPAITAIFSLNDMMAIGALSVARSRGLRVPEDISIAGFDDIPIAADLWPALSTVRVPMVEMGVRALQLALGPHSTNVQVVRLPTELVLRQSTGPARS